MRLFIGIPMAAQVVDQLAAVRARLEQPGDGLRWSASESWHITLQFLGAATSEQYDCLVSHLTSIESEPIPIKLDGIGFFERTGVFFAGVHLSPQLVELQQKVATATTPCVFKPEDRPYHPHVTLARNRGQENGIRVLKPRVGVPPEFAGFTASEFLLYESFPNSRGSRYEVRLRFQLGA